MLRGPRHGAGVFLQKSSSVRHPVFSQRLKIEAPQSVSQNHCLCLCGALCHTGYLPHMTKSRPPLPSPFPTVSCSKKAPGPAATLSGVFGPWAASWLEPLGQRCVGVSSQSRCHRTRLSPICPELLVQAQSGILCAGPALKEQGASGDQRHPQPPLLFLCFSTSHASRGS